eukprot:COSAG03_NODE_16_length_21807_cov_27.080247_5_plen_73_part_00
MENIDRVRSIGVYGTAGLAFLRDEGGLQMEGYVAYDRIRGVGAGGDSGSDFHGGIVGAGGDSGSQIASGIVE